MHYEDKNSYVGEFKEDEREGDGIFTWVDGKQYDGPWVNNKQEGIAMLKLPNGKAIKAEFHEGVKVRYLD